jgi:hypothetical protein
MKASFHFSSPQMPVHPLTPEELIKEFGSRRKQYYRTFAPITFRSARFMVEIAVPAGFLTDLASVPAYLRSIVDNDDPGVLLPAIVHDYVCRCEGRVAGGPFSRREADDMMLEGMEVCGLPTTKRRLVYFAIRFGSRFLEKKF